MCSSTIYFKFLYTVQYVKFGIECTFIIKAGCLLGGFITRAKHNNKDRITTKGYTEVLQIYLQNYNSPVSLLRSSKLRLSFRNIWVEEYFFKAS